MSHGFTARAGWALGGAVVAALLAGCGGGEAPSSAAVLSVPAYEQPAGAALQQAASQAQALLQTRAVALPARVVLGAFSEAKALAAAPTVGPRQIGAARSVGATASAAATQALLQWQPTSQGGLAAAVSFSADGAHGLRLGVQVGQLPADAVLRVYRQDRPAAVFETSGLAVLQTIARNLAAGDTGDAARTWWTPDAGGDEATLEIELPPGTPASSVQVAVPQVSHFFADLSLPTEDEFALQTKINQSDACNLDATCYDAYAAQRNAVARMLFTSAGQSYLCTGTLLNDRDSTGTPYFLSANHCISSQTVASTLQTQWFYRSPSCNSYSLSSGTVARSGGATLLYASESTDTSFLQLADTPPAGAVFAAWDANPQALGSAVAGLHHPLGDLLKISFGSISAQAACSSASSGVFSCTTSASGNFYRVNWTQGLTQGGSSGSGIFHGSALVGTLYGGSSVCSSTTAPDYYGRFDVAYAAALKNWLSPGTTTTPPAPPVAASPTTLAGWITQLQNLPPLNPNQPVRMP